MISFTFLLCKFHRRVLVTLLAFSLFVSFFELVQGSVVDIHLPGLGVPFFGALAGLKLVPQSSAKLHILDALMAYFARYLGAPLAPLT
jgi:hypothetical protein